MQLTNATWQLAATAPSYCMLQATGNDDVSYVLAAVAPADTALMQPGDSFTVYPYQRPVVIEGLDGPGLNVYARKKGSDFGNGALAVLQIP